MDDKYNVLEARQRKERVVRMESASEEGAVAVSEDSTSIEETRNKHRGLNWQEATPSECRLDFG